jgi:hypothetical protein
VLYGGFVLLFLNWLMYPLMGLATPAKLAMTAVALLPLGFFLGTLFPQLVRQLGRDDARFIPWAFALNGIFSVICANLGAVLYVFFGATAVFLLGMLAYAVLAVLPAAVPREAREREVA